MKLLDNLNIKYEKEAKTIPALVAELNAEGRLTSKDFMLFVAGALEEVDKLLSE